MLPFEAAHNSWGRKFRIPVFFGEFVRRYLRPKGASVLVAKML